MDLSHLVSIGLFPAKRKPLTATEVEYFRQHHVDQTLSDLVDELARLKPPNPHQFISEWMAKRSPLASPGQASGPKAAVKAAQAASPAARPAASEAKPEARASEAPRAAAAGDLEAQIKAVGDQVRDLKAKLKEEGVIGKKQLENSELKELLERLQQLKAQASADPSTGATAAAPATAAASAKPENTGEKPAGKAEKKPEKKPAVTSSVVAKQPSKGGGVDVQKEVDVPGWYEQVLMKSELIEQYPVKGCFILRPWAYRIWELIQGWFDGNIKELGVENCYFPMFIPKCYMEKEKDHLDDFAPELAMVTKFGNTDIEEPVAIRPTSETAMYAAYSNWIQSHRDLPVRLNQWCSVVRWEVKQTTPFLRTREFLWQEGHTAYAEKAAAEKEVLDILELYAGVYEHLLALPVVRGTKTKAETFPGADYTTTVEAFIPATGRAIQGATSHHLGQNFSKMFEISFQDPKDASGKAKEYAYQNSWGITQRTIGVMTMVHGDNKGLVLPPRVACFQVVIVPVGLKASTSDEERKKLGEVTEHYYRGLTQAGLRVKLDDGDQTPGWKFNYWEMKGVPLRIELGPLDIKKGEFVMAKRNILDQKAAKVTGKDASFVEDVKRVLDNIQQELYDKALAQRDEHLASIDEWKDFSPALNKGKMVLVPFCGDKKCEEMIKEKSKEEAADVEVAGGLKMGAKSLCVPHEDKYNVACPSRCILPECDCDGWSSVTRRTLFGRSY